MRDLNISHEKTLFTVSVIGVFFFFLGKCRLTGKVVGIAEAGFWPRLHGKKTKICKCNGYIIRGLLQSLI